MDHIEHETVMVIIDAERAISGYRRYAIRELVAEAGGDVPVKVSLTSADQAPRLASGFASCCESSSALSPENALQHHDMPAMIKRGTPDLPQLRFVRCKIFVVTNLTRRLIGA